MYLTSSFIMSIFRQVFRFTGVIILFLYPFVSTSAQDFSNKGTDFWVGYGLHTRMYSNGSGGTQQMVLYFATEAATNVKIEIPLLGYSQSYSIPANTIFTSNPLPKTGSMDARLRSEGISSQGIHITSDKPVVAYAHIYNGNVSGATLLFPTNTLGREYYSMNFTQVSNEANSNSFCYAVATDTGTTTIEVIPSAPTLSMNAGQTYTFTLKQGEIFNMLGQEDESGNNVFTGSDLTGTIVRSKSINGNCKRIAVFSGAGKIMISCGSSSQNSSDNYMVQAFPKNAWGKYFLTVPTKTMESNFFRIGVQDASTVVKVNGVVQNGLTGGFYYQLNQVNAPTVIESDKPIMVAQYITTQNSCGNSVSQNLGDPEVIYLSPVEQNINKVILNSTPNSSIVSHYLNVVIPNGGTALSSFKIDGINGGGFITHPWNSKYSYLQLQVGAGQHTIQSDSGFNAIAYGFGSYESYGYNAGTNVIDLYQYISTQNVLATIKSPVACKKSPFNVALTFPYVPVSMKVKIQNFPEYVNSSPVADSSFELNGRTLYVFKLPGQYIYDAIGTYTVDVKLVNPTPEGCPGEQTLNFDIQVYDPPVVDFTFNSQRCTDSTISFVTNNTSGGRPIIKHFWDFGDGTYAYTNNPNKIYSQPGVYLVRYSALTDVGCLSDTLVKTLEVTNTPISKFGVSPIICIGKNIVFSDSSKLTGVYGTITNWNWNLGNGTVLNNTSGANVVTSYPANQNYNVTLQVKTNSNCFSPVYTVPVFVNPNPAPDFSMSIACLPDGNVQFTNTSTISSGTINTNSWNFGDPASGPLNSSALINPVHKYSTVGPYSIKLITTSAAGCVDSVTKVQNTIYPQPKAAFTAPTEVCYRTDVSMQDGTNGFTHPVVKWEWRFINASNVVVGTSTLQNPVFNFPSPGTYTIRHWAFTNQNCVSDTIEKKIIVNALPVADFSVSNPLCEKNQVTFTNLSTSDSGTVVRWNWNLGDGTTSNLNSGSPFNHVYTNWGTYVVRLLVESSRGCKSDTMIKPVQIHPLPVPGALLPEVCLTDAAAIFTDTSKIADNSEALFTYLWKFNTGTPPVSPAPVPAISTSKNPSIKFNKADNYQLSLTVTSKDGCKDSILNIPFTVNGSVPKSDFAVLSTNGLCSNQDVQIQNLSTVDFGNVTKIEIYWDDVNAPTVFETDETPSPNKIYSHRYPDFQSPVTKTYRIRFRAYSGIICVNDMVKNMVVNASPLTQFLPIPGICVDAVPRQITQASETGGLAGVGIFSGPGVSSNGIFDPAVAGVGIHTIRYTFNAANGCTHFSEQTIEVWPRPIAKPEVLLPTCEKNAVAFTGVNSVSNAAGIAQWHWNYADGSAVQTTASPTVNHVFAAYGTYNVQLTVTNDRGCVSLPVIQQVQIHPLPRVDFQLPKVCLPDGQAAFKDLSVIPDGTASTFTYKWDFGDGFANPVQSDTSILKNPVYKYSNLGPYNVQLIVRSENNCVDSLTKQLVDVFPQPKAAFISDKDSICVGDAIRFTDQSNGIVRGINQWNWSFGNGDNSSVRNPTYIYPNNGSFTVKLVVYSTEGCISDTATKQINVWAYPVVTAGPDFYMLQDAVKPIAGAKASTTSPQYLWSPSTYLNNVNVLNPLIVKPQDDITYTLTVTGRGGCKTSDNVFVKILKAPQVPNTFTPNGDGFNDRWEIKYLGDYPGCIIEVYNTAGTIVYRSVGYTTPWDGNWNGHPLPAGTYYYVIDPKNERGKMKGYVTILR